MPNYVSSAKMLASLGKVDFGVIPLELITHVHKHNCLNNADAIKRQNECCLLKVLKSSAGERSPQFHVSHIKPICDLGTDRQMFSI